MIGLIRKDFYLNRYAIIAFSSMAHVYAILMLIASFLMRTIESPINMQDFSMINTLMFFSCAMGKQGIMAQTDLGKKTRYYFCASPTCVNGFVASKYYESFLIGFITFLSCEVYDLVLSLIYGTLVNSTLIHVAFLFMMMTMQSIVLPCFIGFGKHWQHIITVIILFVFVCVAIYGLFGDISSFMKESGVIAVLRNLMEHADTQSIMAWILGKGFSTLVFLLLLPHLFVLLVYVSYRASCALFRRGAMTYEA